MITNKEKLISKEELMNNVGINIKKICKNKNINMMWLAEQVDMSYEYLRQIVSPKGKKQLSFYSIYKFSIVLGVTIDKLIEN